MWREQLQSISQEVEFNPPAKQEELDAISKSLKVAVPAELAELLLETNGLKGEYSIDLVWPCERIIKDNLDFRTDRDFAELYMTFDSLFFFGNAGCGDQFAFAIHKDGKIHKNDIFVWNHENDNREWASNTLGIFLKNVLTGKIQV